ncbi:MAG: hypothetical protein DRJ10_16070 [Bacteroidetes bacterium]|nr:MAG: hypothetical protein DRJ10_16070 [Bacteroidota bacterium]
MQKELKNLLKLSVAFIAIIFFFSIARLYFYFSNQDIFDTNADFNLLNAFTNGFVYDLKFVFAINSIIIVLFFLPFRFRNTIFWQFIVKLFFTILNSSLVFLSFIDSKYYHIVGEHIKFFNIPDKSLYEQFISSLNKIDFQFYHSWDIVLVGLFTFIVLWSSFPSINKMYFERSKANLYFRFVISSLSIFFLWSSINEAKDKSGDWQVDLFRRTNHPTARLAINSPYYMLRFYYSDKLANNSYFDEKELRMLFSSEKNYFSRKPNKKNIIIINYSNTIENWKKLENNVKKLGSNYYISDNFSAQIKNVPKQMDELLLSFPAFSKSPLINSPYAFNQFQSLVELLKQNGYYTVLAINGSNKNQYKPYHHFYGFDKLVSRKQNHKLLATFEKEVKNTTEDAFFVFFQIDHGINEILTYINENELNKNTLVVANIQVSEKINDMQFGKTLYLMPDTLNKYFVSPRTQNLDIYPSVVDYLNLNEKFIAFGKSVFYKTKKLEVFQYTGQDYVILEDSLLLRYNGQSTKWIIDYKNDPDEFFDLQDSLPVQTVQLKNKIRAIIQKNNEMLIQNKMTISD